MNNPPLFILIDDAVIDLTLTSKAIKNYNRRAKIIIFMAAEAALYFLEHDDMIRNETDIILLTDLHMPQMNGFTLLQNIEDRFKHLMVKLHVFVLSAGASPDEIQRLMSFRCLVGFYDKPLSLENINKIMECVRYPM